MTGGSPAAEIHALGALLPLFSKSQYRTALPTSVPRKIVMLLSSPQAPLRTHALQAITMLVADKDNIPALLNNYGLTTALIALIQPLSNNTLLLPALELLRVIAETPTHGAILRQAGVGGALRPHLASVDMQVMQVANALSNSLM